MKDSSKESLNKVYHIAYGAGSISHHPANRNFDKDDIEEIIIIDDKIHNDNDQTGEKILVSFYELYIKYFNIFTFPIQLHTFPIIRYGKIWMPAEIKRELQNIIKVVTEPSHTITLVHLYAHVLDFVHREMNLLHDPKNIGGLKRTVKEANEVIELKKKMIQVRDGKVPFPHIRIKFKDGQVFKFLTWFAVGHVLSKFDDVEVNSGELAPEDIISSLPEQNDFYKYFQKKLIISMHKFLINERIFHLVANAKINIKALEFINEFLRLSSFHMYDAYQKSTDDDMQRISIIKKTILSPPKSLSSP